MFKHKKALPSIISLVVILAIAAEGTYAWLNAHTDPIINSFKTAEVNVEIHEEFDTYVKKNVSVQNNGDADAYIRVALIPTWIDEAGNPVGVPASLDNLSIIWGSKGWVKGNDGYYYYTEPVATACETSVLIESAEVKSTSNGYNLNLQVVADAIQSEPKSVAQGTWNVTINNGKIDGNPIG